MTDTTSNEVNFLREKLARHLTGYRKPTRPIPRSRFLFEDGYDVIRIGHDHPAGSQGLLKASAPMPKACRWPR
jgi:hypothetical protein